MSISRRHHTFLHPDCSELENLRLNEEAETPPNQGGIRCSGSKGCLSKVIVRLIGIVLMTLFQNQPNRKSFFVNGIFKGPWLRFWVPILPIIFEQCFCRQLDGEEEAEAGDHAEQGVQPGHDPHLHRGHLLLFSHAKVILFFKVMN